MLSKGRQLYLGQPADAERWFTAGLGLTMLPDTTPVDFIVDQVNIDFGDKSRLYRAGYEGREQPMKQLMTIEDIDRVRATCRPSASSSLLSIQLLIATAHVCISTGRHQLPSAARGSVRRRLGRGASNRWRVIITGAEAAERRLPRGGAGLVVQVRGVAAAGSPGLCPQPDQRRV